MGQTVRHDIELACPTGKCDWIDAMAAAVRDVRQSQPELRAKQLYDVGLSQKERRIFIHLFFM